MGVMGIGFVVVIGFRRSINNVVVVGSVIDELSLQLQRSLVNPWWRQPQLQ